MVPRALRSWLFDLASLVPGLIGVGLRYSIALSLAAKVGDNFYIGRFCTVKCWDQLEIGSNCSIHESCYIDARGNVTIGSDVSIAHHCTIVSFEHSYKDQFQPIKDQPLVLMPIVISDNVWVGAGSRLLGGSSLKERSIVAAGSIVKGGFRGGVIVGGVPAKIIKELDS